MLLAVLFNFTSARADELTVYDGTDQTSTVPFNGFYADYGTRSQFIIPADDLTKMAGGSISKLTFYANQETASFDQEVTVYLKEVDYSTFASATLENWDDMTVVYTGNIAVNDYTMEIEFDSPFAYGSDNLMIGLQVTAWGSAAPNFKWLGENQPEGSYPAVYNNANSSHAWGSATRVSFIPKTTLTYTGGGSVVIVEKPQTFEVSGITSSEAVLTWTGGTGTYNVEYKKAADADWTVALANTTASTYTLTGLESATAYQARVQSVSGSDVSGWKSLNFTTAIDFPYTEDFTAGLPASWTRYTGLLENILNNSATLASATSGWSVGTTNGVLDGNNALANIYGTSCQKWLVTPAIPVPANSQLAFDVAYTAYSGTAVAPNATGTDDKFVVLISTDDKATWTVLRQWDNAGSEFVLNDLGPTTTPVILDLSAYAGKDVYVAFYVESTTSNADNNLHIDNVSFEEKPAVETPYGLKISYTGGTEATISWTSAESAWDMDVNGTIKENVDNPTTLPGLAFATTYNIKVRAKKGTEVSSWSAPASFSTIISDDMCQIKLVLLDSWGDGWNDGAAIQIADVASGIVIGTFKNDGSTGKDPQTIVVDVPNDRDIQFSWIAGGQYDSECSYTAYDINDEVIFSGSGAFTDPVTWHVSCVVVPWKAPSDLAASEITATSAKLSWTENSTTPATSWVVAYKEATETDFGEETATENPYVLEGLSPETKYVVKVRPATNEAEKWSDEITFTTDVQFPAPADIAASNVTAQSADISWTGNAEATSYNLRYAECNSATCDFESVEAWSVDNFAPFTAYDGDGASTYTVTNATFTNQGYTGSVITMENGVVGTNWTAHSGDKFGCFMDCTTPPNNDFFITPEVTITEGSTFSFWARSLTDQYGLERMKVGVYGGSGTFSSYLEGSASDYVEVPLDWTEYSYDLSAYKDQTIQLAINCVSDDAFALFIDDVSLNIPPSAWSTPVTGISTTSYQLDGLTPETNYEVQVQAVYAGGESKWAGTVFTTLEDVPTPTALAAAEITKNSVKLSWTENGTATAWEICLNDDEINLISADENPFTVTGLTPETDYTAKVRAINGEKKSSWSAAVNFTTSIAFPAPTGLAAGNVTSSSAEISWTTVDPDATSAELQYTAIPVTGGTVLSYDDGNQTNSIGSSSASTWTWGVMYPASMITGNALSKVIMYETADYNTGDITINVYAGGDSEPGTLLYTEVVTPEAANAFHEVTLKEPVELPAGENLWITLTETGTYVLTGVNTNNPVETNNQWVESGDSWYLISQFSSTGSFDNVGWMIRAEVGTADFSSVTWTTVDNATSPEELTGLTPATTYTVKVKNIYGTDGESEWTTILFTTLSANPVPYDIEADLAADAATLTWEGEGESYNVRYRTAGSQEVTLYDDFNSGLGNWTIYTEGEGPGWVIGTEYGVNAATAYSYENGVGAYAADNWLITPAVELDGILQFYVGTAAQYPDSYEVLLSTTGNQISDFTETLQAMATGTTGWVNIDLSAYAGQTGYIAIHHVSTNCYLLAIAYFGIYGDYTPEGSWQEMAVTDKTATLTGLATNNGYEYEVQSVKGSDVSEWSATQEFALLTLGSDADNAEILFNNYGRQAHVTLDGRTLYADGTWNTICLPFDLDATQLAASPLAGADFRTLEGITVTTNSVELNFSAQGAHDDLDGGYPWIIKWAAGGSDIVDPQFANVIINNELYSLSYEDATSGYSVNFKGTQAPKNFTAEDQSIAFIGANNELNYPLAGAKVGAFRGYFELGGFTLSGETTVKIFTGDLDEDPTGISEISEISENSDWYDLSGRKLAGKPSMKGIYVNGGRKVTVK